MAAIAYPGSAAVPLETDLSDAGLPYTSALASYGSASLSSTVLNYKYENGGRYHAYNEGKYMLLNDEAEHARLDMLHHIFKVLTGGELWRAPMRGPNAKLPKRVLDLGSGTGLWAMEVADELPGATVVGNDLSAIAPKFIPPNCQFVVENFEQQWAYGEKEKFDFIHGRALSGSVSDFPKLLKQIYDNLNPGGWVEFQDHTGKYSSDDDTLKLVPAMEEWHCQLRDASEKAGKPLVIADEYKRLFEEAGFVDVHEDRYKGPIGTWAKSRTLKELGLFLLAQNLDMIEPFTLALYPTVLGYSVRETHMIVNNVKKDFMNKDAHIYVPFIFVYGRKPL